MPRVRTLAVTVALALCPALAAADGLDRDEKPWSRNVSDDDQREARKLYASGNEQFKAERHTEALALYDKALERWEHPFIRLNAAASCIELERYLAAAVHIEAAATYRDHLKPDDQRKLAAMSKRVEAKTGIIEVVTEQAGAALSIDGEQILVGPGSAKRRVLAGKHAVVAQRAGLESDTRQIEVAPGQVVAVKPVLFVVASKWRWATWKPWALAGVGVAIAAVGAPLLISAQSKLDERAELANTCGGPCDPNSAIGFELAALKTSADRRELSAITAFAVGGATIATGVVLAILNRPTQTKRPAEDGEVQAGLWRRGDATGVTLSVRY